MKVVAVLESVTMASQDRTARHVMDDELGTMRKQLALLYSSTALHDGSILYLESDQEIVGHQVIVAVHRLRPTNGEIWHLQSVPPLG